MPPCRVSGGRGGECGPVALTPPCRGGVRKMWELWELYPCIRLVPVHVCVCVSLGKAWELPALLRLVPACRCLLQLQGGGARLQPGGEGQRGSKGGHRVRGGAKGQRGVRGVGQSPATLPGTCCSCRRCLQESTLVMACSRAALVSTCSPDADALLHSKGARTPHSFSVPTYLQPGCTQLRMQLDVELLLGRHLACLCLHLGSGGGRGMQQ